jgi:hypothetical protein
MEGCVYEGRFRCRRHGVSPTVGIYGLLRISVGGTLRYCAAEELINLEFVVRKKIVAIAREDALMIPPFGKPWGALKKLEKLLRRPSEMAVCMAVY